MQGPYCFSYFLVYFEKWRRLLPECKSHFLIDESEYPAYIAFNSELELSKAKDKHFESCLTMILTKSILVFFILTILIVPSSHAKYKLFPWSLESRMAEWAEYLALGFIERRSHSITRPFNPVVTNLRFFCMPVLVL